MIATLVLWVVDIVSDDVCIPWWCYLLVFCTAVWWQ